MAACSGDGSTPLDNLGSPAQGSTHPAATAAARTPVDPTIVRDYLRYWQGVISAHSRQNPDDATLAEYAGGSARNRVVSAVYDNKRRGYYRRGVVRHQPTVVSATDTTATIQDCADISDWTVYSSRTGRAVPLGAAVPRRRSTYALAYRDDHWVVMTAEDGDAC